MTSIGIDYSLTSPCVCVNTDGTYANSKFYFLTDRNSTTGKFSNITGELHAAYTCEQQRYDQIATWALNIVRQAAQKDEITVTIEDYSFGSKGRVFHIAENCGLLKHHLYRDGFKFDTVPPTVVKKYATGKGNATKEKMYESFLQSVGIDIHKILSPTTKLSSPTTDVVDAWYISQYGHDEGARST